MDLAKHVPEGTARDLYMKEMLKVAPTFNEHAYQVYTIFTQLSFKQMIESKDIYITMMFMQSRPAWLFKLEDVDFLKFIQEEILPNRNDLKEPFDQEVLSVIEARLPPKQQ